MNVVVLSLLCAWPLPPDAGREAFADSTNWPNEPEWVATWPLLSFTPDSGWDGLSANERAAGVGMSVDRAWSVTTGTANTTLSVVARSFALADPLVRSAWLLNALELPDAGDVNGNGRVDVEDLLGDPRVSDLNGNGAIDLEDVARALSDGVDQDQNGRIDDLCGWDFDRGLPIESTDAGTSVRALVAPVNDGLPGIGVCPGCTVLPFVDATLAKAIDAGSRVILITQSDAELPPLDDSKLIITSGSIDVVTFPLAASPLVLSARTLTRTNDSAISRTGCGGAARGTTSISTTTCQDEAAFTLAGIAGLLISAHPSLTNSQLRGLLGGDRVDAFAAIERASVPAFVPINSTSLTTPVSSAMECLLDGVSTPCSGGEPTDQPEFSVDRDPTRVFRRFVERIEGLEWSTSIAAPPLSSRRGLIAISSPPRGGSLAPRYVDVTNLETDTHLFPFVATRVPYAVGLIDGDRTLDLAVIDEGGVLTMAGITERLSAPAGGPVVIGNDVITLEKNGRAIFRSGTTQQWSHELNVTVTSGPAVGKIDGDQSLDLAIADGTTLHVLITDARGPTNASWTAPSRAKEALLADLIGDTSLEVIAERVFDSQGTAILTLDQWKPSDWPAVISRIDETATRSLFQLEDRGDGSVELARYDLERALRDGDSLVSRRLVTTIAHLPSPGGMAALDVTGDRRPELIIPTLDGLIFLVDADGTSAPDSPLSAWGTVLTAPTVGVMDSQVEFSVRTTRGDLVRFLSRGLVNDITWDGPGHDEGNTRNAQTPFHARRVGGLGITDPPILDPCGCSQGDAAFSLLAFASLLLRRRAR